VNMTLSHAETDFIPSTAPSLLDLFTYWLKEQRPSGDDIKLYVTTMHELGYHEYAIHINRHRVGWLDDQYCTFECSDLHVKYHAADPEFFEKVAKHIKYALNDNEYPLPH
jgi:hypothetical protein